MSKLREAGISWVIVGQVTPVKDATMPKLYWIEGIVKAADKAKIPVFLKNNLESLIPNFGLNPTLFRDDTGKLHQEFPK